MEKSVKKRDKVLILMMLCWLVYSCSYLGKVNYSANINSIMSFYNVDKAAAGLVGTFFFFAYGAGQILNGLLCNKFNLKWMIFISLAVSGMVNLIIAITTSFAIIKYLWLINGVSLSILWPSLIRLLAENVPKKDMPKASVIMGTTVATGTLIIYGLSALFTYLNVFKLAFYTAGIILPLVGVVWICTSSKLIKQIREEYIEDDINVENDKTKDKANKNSNLSGRLILLSICVMAIFAVSTNLIKDGLTTWVPTILKDTYSLPDSISIILTLSLPMVAIFANSFAVKVHKKITDFVFQCVLMFSISSLIIVCVIMGLSLNQFVITVIGFTLVCFLVSSCNSVITSIFPLFMKGKINSGLIAGLLNGFCYLGSTISSYGLGTIAKTFGWNAVFWVLFGACILVCVVGIIYTVIKKISTKINAKADKGAE